MNNKNVLTGFPTVVFKKMLKLFEESYDFDAQKFLKKYSIQEPDLKKPFINISFMKLLINEILLHKNSYEVLYKISEFYTPKDLGLLGYLMLHSKNIYEVLDTLCKYYSLIGKKVKPIFTKEDDKYKIVIFFFEDDNFKDMPNYLPVIHLFSIINLINQIISQKISPMYITFKQKKIYEIKNSSIENIKCFFSKEEDAIFFDNKTVIVPSKLSNTKLLNLYKKEAEELLNLKLGLNIFKERVSDIILVSITQLEVSLENISDKLNIHPRVLQKKLKQEGTSFSKLLTEIRMKLAIYYIKKDIEISMIGVFLGYNDLSSFFRVFKKWYKLTPSQWKLKYHK